MKCFNCNSEWKSMQNIPSLFCPFCQTPLIEVKEEFRGLDEVLAYLTSEFGKDFIQYKMPVLQFLRTYFPDGKQECIFVNRFYESGLLKTFSRIDGESIASQKNIIRYVKREFASKYGISTEWSGYIVDCFGNSMGLPNNLKDSLIKIQVAAKNGDSEALFQMAQRYHLGKGVERNQNKYIQLLKKSAENGFVDAKYCIGKELFLGKVCEKDIQKAAYNLVSAAKENHRDSICFILSEPELLNICDLSLEKKLKQLLEEKAILTSQSLLYLSKYFFSKDVQLALELASLSYEKDRIIAWEYYVYILNHLNTQESNSLALQVIKKMALDGNVNACLSMAKYMENQESLISNRQMALYWYRSAAEKGSLDAQLKLATMYEIGSTVDQDLDSAIYWYRVAAENGSELAKNKIVLNSPECIVTDLIISYDDDSESKAHIRKKFIYSGSDYLILEESDSHELRVVHYFETETFERFEIEGINEKMEAMLLRKYGGDL